MNSKNSKDSNISPLAGKAPEPSSLINVAKLLSDYTNLHPDPTNKKQRVKFGTSGHRGSAFDTTFNEDHILAITQAICLYRKQKNINGPLYIGFDTHAISIPAYKTALEVLVANDVNVIVSEKEEYTPTPVISHAILTYNKGKTSGLSDGIVITPSHNPPRFGGFKYNPPSGGPASPEITDWIEQKANEFLENKLKDIKRTSASSSAKSSLVHEHDYIRPYISDLKNIVDMEKIRDSGITIGVDPLGGAGVHYWEPIAELYKLNLTVTNKKIDPTFKFMTVDWDGEIRMNPASPYAMVNFVKLKDQFDIAFACDTDHDRHGIVTKHSGLLTPNHYLSVAASYLFTHRKQWKTDSQFGKTVVCSSMIDNVMKKLGRTSYEVPVGFKWFVEGLMNGSLGLCGEESAGATFNRIDGSVWTTDKDGIVPALLSAEITASLNRDLGEVYEDFEKEFGKTYYLRQDSKATPEEKASLKSITAEQVSIKELAGEQISKIDTKTSGNHAAIGGVKVSSKSGWFVARPSGTEDIYEVYGESFKSDEHLHQILDDAQKIVKSAISNKSK